MIMPAIALCGSPPAAGCRRQDRDNACRRFRLAVTAVTLLVAFTAAAAGGDPLPDWRDGATRQRIQRFVADVTTPGAVTYVTPADRIAVFDDDGTLWSERPRPQGMFALEPLRQLAPAHPEWSTQMPFAGALQLGDRYMLEASDAAVMELVAAGHAGMTQDAFRAEVHEFFATASHPRFGVPYAKTVYQPMRELLTYLRANGFHCFVVTTGSIELVRVLSEDLYGVPADDVIGSSVVTTLREEDGRLVVRRLGTLHALNDGDVKPLSIDLHIGRRPIVAVGNVRSGGDIGMLRYTQGPNPGQARPTLPMLIVHDDFQREFTYDEKDRASLNAAEKAGWAVVSMRWDWRRIFAFEEPAADIPTGPPAAGP